MLVLRRMDKKDLWGRQIYIETQTCNLYKNIQLDESKEPEIYSSFANEFDGEPYLPLKEKFMII